MPKLKKKEPKIIYRDPKNTYIPSENMSMEDIERIMSLQGGFPLDAAEVYSDSGPRKMNQEELIKALGGYGLEAARWIPFLDKALEAGDVYSAAKTGKDLSGYDATPKGRAAISAATLIIPNFIKKPSQALFKALKSPFVKKQVKEVVELVSKNNNISNKDLKSLYRVFDAPDLETAKKYATHIPERGTVGRRAELMGDIQDKTSFDHLNATTDQSWILGKSGKAKGDNLINRYGGENPYIAKLKPNADQFKNIDITDVTDDALAMIKPGTGTNMGKFIIGGERRNITTLLGPKGAQVAELDEILSLTDYLKRHNKNPDFKWAEGGVIPQTQSKLLKGPDGNPMTDAEILHALRVYATNKYGGENKYDFMQIADTIAQVESGNNPFAHQKGGGPGRGKYQYEAASAQSASNRLRDIASIVGYDNPSWNTVSNTQDFSKLTDTQQDIMFLADKLASGDVDLGSLASGDTSSKDFWLDSHWSGKDAERPARSEHWDEIVADMKRKQAEIDANSEHIEEPILPPFKYKDGGFRLKKKYKVKKDPAINAPDTPNILQKLANIYNWRENLAENINPFGYRSRSDKTMLGSSELQRLYDAIVLDKSENARRNAVINKYHPDGLQGNHLERIDLLNMVLGRDQKHGTIEPSIYKPTKAKDSDVEYYKSNVTEEEIKKHLQSDPQVRWNEKTQQYDHKGPERLIEYDPYSDVLGNYVIDKGVDEKGNYISYYDKWDLNPLSGTNNALISTDLENKIQSAVGIKPVEIYGRIYYDPKTGKPIELKSNGGSVRLLKK